MQSRLSGPLIKPLGALRSPAFVAAAAGLVAAAVVFQLVFGWGLIAANAPFWRNPPGALAGPLAAAEAVIADAWTFPFAAARRLAGAQAARVVEAGLAPWLVIAIKSLGLGRALNPVGLQLAVAWLLQPVAMVLLLRAMGARRWMTLAAGALLALMSPLWLAPQAGGPAGSGHFLIILALALAVDSARRGLAARRVLMFCGLVALAMGFFPPHAAVIAALFAAAAMSEIAQGRPGALARSIDGAVRLALTAAAVGLVLNGGFDAEVPAPQIGRAVHPGWGALLLGLVAMGAWLRARQRVDRSAWRRFGPLAGLLVALAIWGVAVRAAVGLEAPAYAALALALIAVEIWWRPRIAGAALATALAAQGFGAAEALGALRAGFGASAPPDLEALRSPRFADRAWVVVPPCRPDSAAAPLINQLSLIAIRTGGVVRLEAGCGAPFGLEGPAGAHDPQVLVAFAQPDPPAVSRRPDCLRIDALVACGRGLTAPAPELRAPYVADFAAGGLTRLGVGWSAPEAGGVWSSAKLSGLILPTPIYAPEGFTLEFEAYGQRPLGGEAQVVIVSHDNARLTRWDVTAEPGAYRLEVPPGLALPGQAFQLELQIPYAVPVNQISPGSSDARELGIFLKQVRVSPLEPRPAPGGRPLTRTSR